MCLAIFYKILVTNDRVRATVIEVEYPLIASQLEQLDTQLENAITSLNWTSNGIMYN